MASRKYYYDILGIRRDATEEEIDKAYRRLARTYQFIIPGNKNTYRFKEISEAYEILSNKDKRERYDRLGQEISSRDFLWEYGSEEEEVNFEGFEDTLERFWGLEGEAIFKQPQKGKDLYRTIEVGFHEAIRGAKKRIPIRREVNCPCCMGKGGDPEVPPAVCNECGGAGKVQIGLPPLAFSQICHRCQGKGKVSKQPCKSCLGRGFLKKKEIIPLEIPAGVNDHCRIYLGGKGQRGKNGGPNGDLILNIKVGKHPYFQRKEKDIYLEVPLSLWEAALGAEVDIPTLYGPTKMVIPPGVQNGEKLHLPGKGVPNFQGGNPGDQIISIKILVPQGLDKKSKKILGDLKRLNRQNPRNQCGWSYTE